MESLLLTLPERGPTLLLRRRDPFTSLRAENPFLACSSGAAGRRLNCPASAAALLRRSADPPSHERPNLRYLLVNLLFLRFQALQCSL